MHQKVQKNTRICATSRALQPLEIKADAMDDVRFVVVARLFSVVCKKGKSMNRNVTKCYKRWWAAIVGVVLQFCWCLQPRLYSNDKFEESFVTITLGQEATNYDRRGQNDNKIVDWPETLQLLQRYAKNNNYGKKRKINCFYGSNLFEQSLP